MRARSRVVDNDRQRAIRLHRQGRFAEALAACAARLRESPDDHEILQVAGQASLAKHPARSVDDAIDYLSRAASISPGKYEYHNDLGTAYWNRRDLENAARCFQAALAIEPRSVEANFNLANCHWLLGRLTDALRCYERTIALDPGWLQAQYMIANCLYGLGETRRSIDYYDKVVSHDRLGHDAEFGKAAAVLKLGRWREGFALYERRLDFDELAAYRQSHRPVWHGEHDPGCTLLVYAEQGIGDLIMFARFLPAVRERVARVYLLCDASVCRLAERFDGVDAVVDKSSVRAVDDIEFDKRVAMMSLAGLLDVQPDSIPGAAGYIDPGGRSSWKENDGGRRGGVSVGFVWSGNPAQKDNAFRSLPPSELSPLLDVEGVTACSLQVYPPGMPSDASALPGAIDLSTRLSDFLDTARVVAGLDLVITVDTAVAHLAGAMGRPVWVLLWTGCCWRYGLQGDDCAWYHSMRLFRQEACADWNTPVSRVREHLRRFVSDNGR